jgi:hypothetical protein
LFVSQIVNIADVSDLISHGDVNFGWILGRLLVRLGGGWTQWQDLVCGVLTTLYYQEVTYLLSQLVFVKPVLTNVNWGGGEAGRGSYSHLP